jgi:hypothetical protein
MVTEMPIADVIECFWPQVVGDGTAPRGVAEDIASWTPEGVKGFLAEWAFDQNFTLKADISMPGESFLLQPAAALASCFADTSQQSSKTVGEELYAWLHPKSSPASQLSRGLENDIRHPSEESFKMPFKDPHRMVNEFMKYTEDCVLHFRKISAKFYAPYFSLVQSSG